MADAEPANGRKRRSFLSCGAAWPGSAAASSRSQEAPQLPLSQDERVWSVVRGRRCPLASSFPRSQGVGLMWALGFRRSVKPNIKPKKKKNKWHEKW
jgi:hypothetical protein